MECTSLTRCLLFTPPTTSSSPHLLLPSPSPHLFLPTPSFSQVLLPDFIVEAVHEGRGFLPSHPDHVSVTGLLKSSLLKECHLTGVPHSWYSESKETGKDKESKIIRQAELTCQSGHRFQFYLTFSGNSSIMYQKVNFHS